METRRKILNRYRRGEKIRSISRDLRLSRNTVRSVIRASGPVSASYVRTNQHYPALGEYIPILDKLFEENKSARPKRNAMQLFKELKLIGYEGSYSAVSRYVSKCEEGSSTVSSSACIPLSFSPGEAYQFDWSTENVILNDEIITVKVAHFVLCYSRKRFTYIYPSEKQEMVFDAHIRAFEFFGGTPARGIYDNMKTAVKKVLKGSEREWNTHFERLCTHYIIEPTGCTPACGNEKGRVERQVRTDREQFFTPMPKGRSLQELNDSLISQLVTYNRTHKHPEYRDKTLDEVFEEERHSLIPAPIPFDGFKEEDITVSNTCLARFDRNSYSIECKCAGKIVQCKPYADKLVFMYDGKEVGCHERRFTRGKTYYNWFHYLPVLARKPGALRNGAPFSHMELPEELSKVRQHLEKQVDGSRDFAHILSYIPIESMESVRAACAQAIKSRTISKDIIVNILLRSNDITHEQEEDRETYFKLKYLPQDDPHIYNQLLSEVSI